MNETESIQELVVKPRKNGKTKAKAKVAITEPTPYIPAGLRQLIERSYKPRAEPQKPLKEVNVRFNKTVRKWELFDNDGKILARPVNCVLVDVEFVVQPCKEIIGGCGEIDVDCGYARGKLLSKGKPKSMPVPTHKIGFDKFGRCFYTGLTRNLKSTDYLILSANGSGVSALAYKPKA